MISNNNDHLNSHEKQADGLTANAQYQLNKLTDMPHENEADEVTVLPVYREVLNINIEQIDTGKGVRVHKSVIEHPHIINEMLKHDTYDIKHISIDQIISSTDIPVSRYEGDTLIMPVYEEILVVEKRIHLKEEIHIIKTQQETPFSETVILKEEQIRVERFNENSTTEL